MIKLSKSCISIKEIKAVNKVLSKEYLGMGPEVKKFENDLNFFFKREVVCVSSGTAALQLALQALGIKKGDEVLVPAITYVATFQAISATGAKLIMCDVDKDNLIISIKDAKKKLTKKTKVIMPVFYAGNPGNIEEIYKFAKKNKIRVIEDAAHAFGSVYKKKKIGSFGDISCFSFDGIKNITSGEGGCVVTDNKKNINTIKDLRLLGVGNDSAKRYTGKRSWNFNVKQQGWRYHMSDINAAIGRVQLKRFNHLKNARQKICKYYDSNFLKFKKVQIFNRDFNQEVPHIYVLLINNLKKREQLRNDLLKVGIQTGYHYVPGYELSYYKSNKNNFPNANSISEKIITLPLHPDLKQQQLNKIVTKIKFFLNKNKYFI